MMQAHTITPDLLDEVEDKAIADLMGVPGIFFKDPRYTYSPNAIISAKVESAHLSVNSILFLVEISSLNHRVRGSMERILCKIGIRLSRSDVPGVSQKKFEKIVVARAEREINQLGRLESGVMPIANQVLKN